MNKINNNSFPNIYLTNHISSFLNVLQKRTLAIALVILAGCSICYVAFSHLKSKNIFKSDKNKKSTDKKIVNIKQKKLDKSEKVSSSKTKNEKVEPKKLATDSSKMKTKETECRIIDGEAHVGKFVGDELVQGKIYYDKEQTKLKFKGSFKNGRLHGEKGKIYNSHGELVWKGSFDRGYITNGSFYIVGKRRFTGSFENFNFKSGSFFYACGKNKQFEGYFKGKDPHGNVIEYNQDGSIRKKGTFEHGSMIEGSIYEYLSLSDKIMEYNGKFSDPDSVSFVGKLYLIDSTTNLKTLLSEGSYSKGCLSGENCKSYSTFDRSINEGTFKYDTLVNGTRIFPSGEKWEIAEGITLKKFDKDGKIIDFAESDGDKIEVGEPNGNKIEVAESGDLEVTLDFSNLPF